MIIIKSELEIKKISYASMIVAVTLDAIKEIIKPNIFTKDIEVFAEDILKRKGGIPAFKGYRGFPASLCISVNNEVVHGIPSKSRKLKEGDIVSVDLGVKYDNFIGDAARTYPVGKIDDDTARLLKVTEDSLYMGIDKARVNNRVSDISSSIQNYVEERGFSVVRDFVGHGVGRNLHEEPQIPNYGLPNKGPRLKKGMVLAIEPMINAGGYEVGMMDNGWTAVTRDGSLSAHFEHTIVVTENNPKILTALN